MAFNSPRDPFLTDALGCARFCKDIIARMMKPKWRTHDFGPAVYWSARCAAHWAHRSKKWKALA